MKICSKFCFDFTKIKIKSIKILLIIHCVILISYLILFSICDYVIDIFDNYACGCQGINPLFKNEISQCSTKYVLLLDDQFEFSRFSSCMPSNTRRQNFCSFQCRVNKSFANLYDFFALLHSHYQQYNAFIHICLEVRIISQKILDLSDQYFKISYHIYIYIHCL